MYTADYQLLSMCCETFTASSSQYSETGGKNLADGTSTLETTRLSLYLPVISIMERLKFHQNRSETKHALGY